MACSRYGVELRSLVADWLSCCAQLASSNIFHPDRLLLCYSSSSGGHLSFPNLLERRLGHDGRHLIRLHARQQHLSGVMRHAFSAHALLPAEDSFSSFPAAEATIKGCLYPRRRYRLCGPLEIHANRHHPARSELAECDPLRAPLAINHLRPRSAQSDSSA